MRNTRATNTLRKARILLFHYDDKKREISEIRNYCWMRYRIAQVASQYHHSQVWLNRWLYVAKLEADIIYSITKREDRI